jgi:hypothetical protein
MSLVRKRALNLQRLAAIQSNGRLSHGPATPEGLERIRAANLRHGFYSQVQGEALRALGEDPAEFETLLESLIATWQPADEFESRLVTRLARALWRMERGDRIQESMAVAQLERMDANVERLACEARTQYEKRMTCLKSVTAAVAQEEYSTSLAEIKLFDAIYGSEPKGRPEQIFVLLYRLLKPRPQNSKPADDEPVPIPDIPVAEGRERREARKELQDLLSQEVQIFKEARSERGDELLETTSPYYRDTMMAPFHSRAALMARMEDSSFRQVERITNLLTKLKARAAQRTGEALPRRIHQPTIEIKRQKGASANNADSQNEGISNHVVENKGREKGPEGISYEVDEKKPFVTSFRHGAAHLQAEAGSTDSQNEGIS